MRPSAFSYSRPATVAQILTAMRHGAVPLAGGQSLLQAMRLRQFAPPALVDLAAASDLSAVIDFTSDTVTFGAQVTHAQCAADIRLQTEFPWLAQAASALGDVQVRNRGTVVGNVCWADPRANFAVAMLASGARVHCRAPSAPNESRVFAIDDFFIGFRQHAAAGQLITQLEIPRVEGRRGSYREFSRQRQDLALVNVCVVLGANYARVVVGGIHHTPLRILALEARLSTGIPDTVEMASLISQTLGALDLQPVEDPYGPPSFKLALAKVELRRVLEALRGADAHV
jgi:aerobic carbon-monoxide dehydrogenase medium subunit